MSLTPTLTKAALAALFVAAGAFAQTPKPAATPAGSGKTLSGKPATGGPILTKDELRACIQREEALKVSRAEIQNAGAALLAERDALLKQSDALKADKDVLEQGNQKTREFNERMKAQGAALEDWGARVKAFNETGSKAKDAKEQMDKLNAEKAELDKTTAALDAERATLASSAADVKALNDKAAALNEKTADWNTRNAKQRDAETSHETDREFWQSECGGRRFREDDEKAIRAGK